MSAIQTALSKLDAAVARAESAASRVKITPQSQEHQHDMFGAPTSTPTESYIDGAVVAQKLNSTIEKMEKLLEDA